MIIQEINGVKYNITHSFGGVIFPENNPTMPEEYRGKTACVKRGSIYEGVDSRKLVCIIESEGLTPFVFHQGRIPKELEGFLEFAVRSTPAVL